MNPIPNPKHAFETHNNTNSLLTLDTSKQHQMPNPTHLYGKNPYPDIDDDGICSGCLGRRNIALKDDPILLCDGVGCKREYHLSCTTPELDSVPEGDFFCIDCDPEGTTACLKKYFDSVEDARCEFVSSRDYVEQQIKNQLKEIEMDEEESSVDYDHSSSADGFYGYNGHPIFSEMDKLEELHAAAMDDSIWREDSDRDSKPRKVTRFGPEFFIGKICKLYCPIDNSYHSGRIIDWRSAILPGTDPKQLPKLFCGKGRIATSEFLIRFPAGCNGRKVTLLKWIILEEHSCAISMDVIHACKEKGRGIRKFFHSTHTLRTYLCSSRVHTTFLIYHFFLNYIFYRWMETCAANGTNKARIITRSKTYILWRALCFGNFLWK